MTLTMQPAIEGFSLSGDGSTINFAGSVSSTSCTGPDGNIWFTDGPNHRLGILNVVTRATTYFVPVGMEADAEPMGICSAYGYLYFCIPNKRAVVRMNTAGVIDINFCGMSCNGQQFEPHFCIPGVDGSSGIAFVGKCGSSVGVGKWQTTYMLTQTTLSAQTCKIAASYNLKNYIITASGGVIPYSF